MYVYMWMNIEVQRFYGHDRSYINLLPLNGKNGFQLQGQKSEPKKTDPAFSFYGPSEVWARKHLHQSVIHSINSWLLIVFQ